MSSDSDTHLDVKRRLPFASQAQLPPSNSPSLIPISIYGSSGGLVTGEHSTHVQYGQEKDRLLVGQSTTDMLTDDALLHIFHFYLNNREARRREWHILIHVCQRWRYLVLASPCHLGLQLEYTGKRPIMEILDVWPLLPITIQAHTFQCGYDFGHSPRCDNILAILNSKHYDRICEITLNLPVFHWERIATTMQKPFPELRHLKVSAGDYLEPVLPDSFLAGSAPRLQTLSLTGISFPAIQKLPLLANGLISLRLLDNPDSGRVSPETMAICLSALPRLKYLSIDFRSRRCDPRSVYRHRLPVTRSVLPTLSSFEFDGAGSYLENLVAHIDAPQLHRLRIHFLMDLTSHAPQLHRFISHAKELNKLYEASVHFSPPAVEIQFAQHHRACDNKEFMMTIPFLRFDRPILSICHVFRDLPPFSTLESLVITDYTSNGLPLPDLNDDNNLLDVLDPFSAVKNLYLCHEIGLRVGYALQGLSEERVPEVLPALQNIFVRISESSSRVQEAISVFAAAKQRISQPVAVHLIED